MENLFVVLDDSEQWLGKFNEEKDALEECGRRRILHYFRILVEDGKWTRISKILV